MFPSAGVFAEALFDMAGRSQGIFLVNNAAHQGFLLANVNLRVLELQSTQGHALHKQENADATKCLFSKIWGARENATSAAAQQNNGESDVEMSDSGESSDHGSEDADLTNC